MEQKLNNLQTVTNRKTICAPCTPPGKGGISVIRVSGPQALKIVDRCWKGRKPLADVKANSVVYGEFNDATGELIDQCVATLWRAPHSFTGEDTVELSFHGSPWIISRAMNALISAGAEVAGNGEFTKQAFLNNRLDLAQAESVADIIAASSKASLKLAMQQMKGEFSKHLDNMRQQLIDFACMLELELDFGEEDVEFADRENLQQLAENVKKEIDRLVKSYATGRVFREGVPVVIAGQPNVGKSTLLNALLQEEKAIVTDIPGTTRDLIEDTMEIGDLLFRFIDTAGLRITTDPVEKIGVERSLTRIQNAAMVMWVIDSTADIDDFESQVKEAAEKYADDRKDDILRPWILVLNKTDIADNLNHKYNITETLFKPLINKDNTDSKERASDDSQFEIISISAKNNENIDKLTDSLQTLAKAMMVSEDEILVTNARHYAALTTASEALSAAITNIENGLSADFIAQDVRIAQSSIGEVTGAITSDTLLHTIFSRFCIGK